MPKKYVALSDEYRRVGQSHPQAKLTDAEVDKVFELREAGMSLSVIAAKFGVQKPCIHKIVTGANRCQTPAHWRPAGEKRSKGTQPRQAQPQPEAIQALTAAMRTMTGSMQ